MWQASPKTAIEALQQDHAQRTVANQKAELLGDERARSEDAAVWVNDRLKELGVTRLPPSTSRKQIDSIMGMLLKGQLTDNPLHRYRDRDVTDAVAEAGVLTDALRSTNNARTYGEWHKSIKLQVTTLPKPDSFFNLAPISIDRVAENERLPGQAAEPDMSIYQNWKNLGKTSNDMRNVLGHYVMVASLVNTQYKPPDMSSWKKRNNNSGAEYFDVDEAAMASIGPTFDEIGRIFRMQGWTPLSKEERELLATPLISSIDDMKRHTDYITPVFYQSPPTPEDHVQGQQPPPPESNGMPSRQQAIADAFNSQDGQRQISGIMQFIRNHDPAAQQWIRENYEDKQNERSNVGAIVALETAIKNNPAVADRMNPDTLKRLEDFMVWLSQQVSRDGEANAGGNPGDPYWKTLKPDDPDDWEAHTRRVAASRTGR